MRVASRSGHWVWSLGEALDDVISGQCVFRLSNLISLPGFHTFFFQVHHNQPSSLYTSHFI